MDKFLIKGKTQDPHLPVHINAADRAKKYPSGTFHADKNLLFCSSCNIVIDHLRKSKVDKHLESNSHKEKLNRADKLKQKTVRTAFECKSEPQLEKVKVCQEWLKACTAANIPLHKSDNPLLRTFLKTRVVNGGAIPKASQLRDYYLFDIYEVERADLKQLVQNKNVAIITDELSDDEGRYVLDVMAVLLDFDELSPSGNSVAYLLDSHFLDATNNRTVSQAIVKTVHDYGIDYDNVRVFNSDNVGYMKKAYNDTLSCLFPMCIHITCHSHIVNLVACDLKKGFAEVNEFVKCFRNLFYVPSGRKSRFLEFLKESLGREDVLMPPNPTTKSWGAWFDSVVYHANHAHLCGNFIKQELERGRSAACASLLRLEDMYDDEFFMKKLSAHLAFLKEKAPTVRVYMDYFQQRAPRVTEAHGKMESLLFYLEQNAALTKDDISFCFQDADCTDEELDEMLAVVTKSFGDALKKLQKYVVDGAQPASKFLQQVTVLNPMNIVSSHSVSDDLDCIPGLEAVSRDEWDLYVNLLGPAAVKESKDGVLDVRLFWKANAAKLPELYKLASCYCTATIGSYEVERAFSAYADILDCKRRSLDRKTIRAFHFLNWNLRVKTSLEEEQHNPKTRVPSAKPAPVARQPQTNKHHVPGPVPPVLSVPVPNLPASKIGKSDDMPSAPVPSQSPSKAPPRHTPSKRKNKKNDKGDSSKKRKCSRDAGLAFRSSLQSTKIKKSYPPVNQGLDRKMCDLLTEEDECTFPPYKEPLVRFLIDESDKFNGGNLILQNDLQSLLGENPKDEDNYLCNFVIDAYLERLCKDSALRGIKAKAIESERFEKLAGKSLAAKLSFSVIDQDVVVVPCISGQHWTLLVVLPPSNEILVLDSIANAQVKPTSLRALHKMCDLLREVKPDISLDGWRCSVNSEQDIAQQPNTCDCGAYVCAYARSILLQSPMPSDFRSFRRHILLELHHGATQPFDVNTSPVVGKYYAMEYERNKKMTYYIGRAVATSQVPGSMEYKFLHSIRARVFDWPTRDDLDTCHESCVFYGPVSIDGNGPFSVNNLEEVEQVFTWLKKA